MVSNQEKVMIIRKKKCCKPRKIKVCKKNLKKISTHLLTALIIGAILQLEQRKGNKRKIRFLIRKVLAHNTSDFSDSA